MSMTQLNECFGNDFDHGHRHSLSIFTSVSHGIKITDIPFLFQVSLIYKDPSIGNSMTISVVRIVLIDKDVLDAGKPHTWKHGKSASAILHRLVHRRSCTGYIIRVSPYEWYRDLMAR